MVDVKYLISISASKFHGYQSKKDNMGYVKAFVSNLWDHANADYNLFVLRLIHIFIHERVCLERGFQRIKIKGGMCKPCCVRNVAGEMYEAILDDIIEDD